MRIFPWLPAETSYGGPVRCETCARMSICADDQDASELARSIVSGGHGICGSWEEAAEIQVNFMDMVNVRRAE